MRPGEGVGQTDSPPGSQQQQLSGRSKETLNKKSSEKVRGRLNLVLKRKEGLVHTVPLVTTISVF